MRKSLLATVASLALMGSASAADLVPQFTAQIYSWSGFYAGVDIGAVWGQKMWDDRFDASFTTSYPINGVLGGVHGGWNHQMGPLVIGAEGNLAFSNARGSVQLPSNEVEAASLSSQINWIMTLVGRGGIASGPTLYYLVAGLAVMGEQHTAEARNTNDGFFNQTVKNSRSGWVLGFGIEYAVTPNLSAKLEYNYMDFGKKNMSFPVAEAEPLILDQQTNVVKVGLSYRFGGSPDVLVK